MFKENVSIGELERLGIYSREKNRIIVVRLKINLTDFLRIDYDLENERFVYGDYNDMDKIYVNETGILSDRKTHHTWNRALNNNKTLQDSYKTIYCSNFSTSFFEDSGRIKAFTSPYDEPIVIFDSSDPFSVNLNYINTDTPSILRFSLWGKEQNPEMSKLSTKDIYRTIKQYLKSHGIENIEQYRDKILFDNKPAILV